MQSERDPQYYLELSDEELVLAAVLGDFGAYDELVRRYRPAVVATARRVAGDGAADDVAQDALLIGFKALPQLADPSRFGVWIGAITRNRALRMVRKKSSREESGSEWDDLILEQTPHLSPTPEQAVETGELRSIVRACVERLSSTLAPAMVLYYFEDMPVRRIAAVLGLTETTVKWRLYQGRLALRRLLLLELPGIAGEEEKG